MKNRFQTNIKRNIIVGLTTVLLLACSSHSELDKNIKNIDLKEFENIKIEIKVSEEKNYAYIRHKGYNPQIRHTWQRLLAYAYEENIQDIIQIGIHHDNPLITKSEDCQYIAGIEVEKNFRCNKSFSILSLNSFLNQLNKGTSKPCFGRL